MTKNWFKRLWERYFSRERLLYPTLLFFPALLAVKLLLWRIHMLPVIYEQYFYWTAGLAALVGYCLAKSSTSKAYLLLWALIAVLFGIAYAYSIDTLTGVTFGNVALLVLLYSTCIGALLSALRILINMGLH